MNVRVEPFLIKKIKIKESLRKVHRCSILVELENDYRNKEFANVIVGWFSQRFLEVIDA